MDVVYLFGIVFLFAFVKCDTPANCTYDDIEGEWIFFEGQRESNSTINCSHFAGPAANILKLSLRFPNVVFDDLGNKGHWTIIYNQGFEFTINYRKFFAFSWYEQSKQGNTTSYCNRILPGWSHDVLGKNWACFTGGKVGSTEVPKVSTSKNAFLHGTHALNSEKLIERINKAQKSWRATSYKELTNMPLDELIKRAGGKKSRISSPPKPSPVTEHLKNIASQLPVEFDWRDVNGMDYVSPVRNQGTCGSCYAFSSLAMLESRLRIMTNNTIQVQFSPQDVVSCSEYSQGCEGGFPYVIAGKYAQDFGILSEDCYPYEGQDNSCKKKDCKRFYVAHYKYVGGFYGGCNEELMRLDLIRNGPVTVAFEVYPDFMTYSSGVYHHTGIGVKFNPFHEVNHGVLITGYGVDNKTGEKYWVVKNSWGTAWGEQGYFRIRRGTNECNIESMAVSAMPIP